MSTSRRSVPLDPAARASPLTFRRLAPVALLLATVVGLFSTIVLKVAVGVVGGSIPWAEAATGWVDWYIWAALTPLVVWLARIIPVTGATWLRALATHVVLGAIVAAGELALFASSMTVYFPLFIGVELPPFSERYPTLVGRWLPPQMLIYALIVAVVTAIEHGRRARERDVTAARLEGELTRAQMHALQAQIQPHFLFNTLNTISMAVRQGRDRVAVRMMAHLSRVLRSSMDAATRPESTLGRELELVRDYLQIEQCRLEERLTLHWEVDEDTLEATVPTMLLQPLVENAVRHGVAEIVEGGEITVRATRENGSLFLTVEDNGPGLSPDAESGVGIGNVRRRLETRYGRRSSLSLEARDGGGTLARITLPIEVDDHEG